MYSPNLIYEVKLQEGGFSIESKLHIDEMLKLPY